MLELTARKIQAIGLCIMAISKLQPKLQIVIHRYHVSGGKRYTLDNPRQR
jgi:ubiquitin C-terminal hydrolase